MRTIALLAAASLLLGACGSEHQRVSGRPPTSTTFRTAVNAVLPAVVYIQVQEHPETVPPSPTQGPDPHSPDSPGAGSSNQGGGPAVPSPEVPPGLPARGAGSGVLFRPDGYILTSRHVVHDADYLSVTLHDHRQFDARVVAEDPSTDVAVVKIEANNLPSATLGNSDQLEPGDWVLALGAPLGLQFSVTAGVVSAIGRAIGILDASAAAARAAPLEHFIQTDAAINPGNSGGPLVDLSGRVVGINTAIATTTGVYAGAGFAVPINLARRTAEQLVRYGEARRAFLGAVLADVTDADARVFQLPSVEGATLVHVDPRGPAAAAGLRMGDVVVRMDTVPILTTSDLQNALARLDPGHVARFSVVRYGQRLSLPVRLGLVTSGEVPHAVASNAPDTIGVGFAIVPVATGVIVGSVRPYSAAERASVRPGQIIEAVNRRPVRSVQDFIGAVRGGNGVLSLVVVDQQVGRMIINYSLKPGSP